MPITETELRLIAALAIIGLRRIPNTGCEEEKADVLKGVASGAKKVEEVGGAPSGSPESGAR